MHWLHAAQTPAVKATQKRLADVSLNNESADKLKHTRPSLQTVLLLPPQAPAPVINSSPVPLAPPKPRQKRAPPLLSEARAPAVYASSAENNASSLAFQKTPISQASTASSTPSSSAVHKFPQHLRITYTAGPIPAELEWKVKQGRYTLTLRTLALMNVAYKSQGYVGAKGLQPSQFQEIRKGQLKYQVDFDWQTHTVFIGEPDTPRVENLKAGDQDMFSAGFQLALLGSRLKDFTFSVATSRKWYANVPFSIAGEAKIQIGEKWVDTLLLKGHYRDKTFEFWLAPAWGNIPVRIKIDTDKANYLITAIRVIAEGKVLAEPVSQLDQPSGDRKTR